MLPHSSCFWLARSAATSSNGTVNDAEILLSFLNHASSIFWWLPAGGCCSPEEGGQRLCHTALAGPD
eukprot:1157408-Pelagomonas_calceolata.AAC.5